MRVSVWDRGWGRECGLGFGVEGGLGVWVRFVAYGLGLRVWYGCGLALGVEVEVGGVHNIFMQKKHSVTLTVNRIEKLTQN